MSDEEGMDSLQASRLKLRKYLQEHPEEARAAYEEAGKNYSGAFKELAESMAEEASEELLNMKVFQLFEVYPEGHFARGIYYSKRGAILAADAIAEASNASGEFPNDPWIRCDQVDGRIWIRGTTTLSVVESKILP